MKKTVKNVFYLFLILSSLCLIFLLFSCKTTSIPAEKTEETPATETSDRIEDYDFKDPSAKFAVKLKKALNTGTAEDALALFDEMPEDLKDDEDLIYLKATLQISAGQYTEASATADELAAKDPDNLEITMLQANIAKVTGNKNAKKAALNKILEKDPANADANTELANEMMLRRSYANARKLYAKALSGNADHINALAGYGQSSYYLGKLNDSERALRKIISLEPENAFAWAYLAKLAVENSNNKRAIEYVEKAISYEPDNYDWWLDYGNYLRNSNRTAEARAAWEKAVELDPGYFLGHVYLAGIYDDTECLDKAYDEYMQVVKLNPDYYFAYEALGILAWGNGNWEGVEKWFRKALELYPKSTSYQMMIALSYFKRGDKKTAKDYISKTVLKNLDKNSTEYALMRLFYDNISPGTVANKIQNETNSNTRGKLYFYLAEYFDLQGNDVMAEKYHILVHELQCPIFFEYRMNEWAYEEFMNTEEK